MLFKLHNITPDNLLTDKKKVILYGDFNVLTYLNKYAAGISEKVIIYPDSTALFLVLKYLYGYCLTKKVSTDLQENLLTFSGKNKIFLFGDRDIVLDKIKSRLGDSFNICGARNGYNYDDEVLCKEINNYKTDILLVGLGVSRQEQWILNNSDKLNVKLIISVGGWFQYVAGLKTRAPKFLSVYHLEWSYKLIKEFRRVWRRYFITLPIFLIRVLTGSILLVYDENIDL